MSGLHWANNARLEEIELSEAIHLAFDELQLCNLSLCLAVRPGRRDRGGNGRFVLEHAVGERHDETRSRPLYPWVEYGQVSLAHHGMEGGNDLACLHEAWHTVLDGRHCDGFGPRQLIATDGH